MVSTPAKSPARVSTAQAIYDSLFSFFRGQGFGVKNAQVSAAAILGNDKIESGFSPTAFNPRENAHGFSQWENGRWSGPGGLQSYAAGHHLDPLSVQAEIGFTEYELTHGFAGVTSQLRGQTDIYAAAQTVQAHYEISDPATLGARQSAAASILDAITHGRPLTSGPLTSSTGGAAGFAGASTAAAGGNYGPTDFNAVVAAAKAGTLTGAQMDAWFSKLWHITGSVGFTADVAVQQFSDVLSAAKQGHSQAGNPGVVTIDKNNLSVETSPGVFSVHPLTGVSDQGVIDKLKNIIAGATNAVVDAVASWLDPLFKKLGQWAVDGLVILVGVAALIIAFVLVAKSTGTDVTQHNEQSPGPAKPAAPAEAEAAAE